MAEQQEISSNFNVCVDGGKGIESPDYDVLDVAVILKATENGVLVHEVVTNYTDPSTWVNGKEGTGDISRDAVSYYKTDDFLDAYPDKGDAVAIETYQHDYKGIDCAFQSAPNTPVADDAMDMKNRLVEMGKDLEAYETDFAAQAKVSNNVTITAP